MKITNSHPKNGSYDSQKMNVLYQEILQSIIDDTSIDTKDRFQKRMNEVCARHEVNGAPP